MTRRPRLEPPEPTGVLAELVELIGDRAVHRLCDQWAGRELYIPHAPGPDHRLAIVGRDAASLLGRIYGGATITVPMAKQWRAVRLLLEGRSIAATAAAVGVHERSVFRYMVEAEARAAAGNRGPGVGRQMPLPW